MGDSDDARRLSRRKMLREGAGWLAGLAGAVGAVSAAELYFAQQRNAHPPRTPTPPPQPTATAQPKDAIQNPNHNPVISSPNVRLVFLGNWSDPKFARLRPILQDTLKAYTNCEVYKRLRQYEITGVAKVNPFTTYPFSYKEGGHEVNLPNPPGYYPNETPPFSDGPGVQEQLTGDFAKAMAKLIPQISAPVSQNITENEQLIFVLPPDMPYWGGYHATALTEGDIKRPYAVIGFMPFFDILSAPSLQEMVEKLKNAPLETLLDSKTVPDPQKPEQPAVYSGIGAVMTHEFAEMITDPDIEIDPTDPRQVNNKLQSWTSEGGGDEIADPAEGNYCYMMVNGKKS